MKAFLLILISVTVLTLTSCSTVGRRSEEKAAVFNALDPQTQTRLKQSVIKVGDTPDMVYIALGHPDRVREKTTATGRDEIWIYAEYSQEYAGPYLVGYRRHSFRDGNEWRIYYEPFRDDMALDTMEEYMRVIFQDEKVIAIEQTKR
jgi:hypothetical protein